MRSEPIDSLLMSVGVDRLFAFERLYCGTVYILDRKLAAYFRADIWKYDRTNFAAINSLHLVVFWDVIWTHGAISLGAMGFVDCCENGV